MITFIFVFIGYLLIGVVVIAILSRSKFNQEPLAHDPEDVSTLGIRVFLWPVALAVWVVLGAVYGCGAIVAWLMKRMEGRTESTRNSSNALIQPDMFCPKCKCGSPLTDHILGEDEVP